MPARPPSARRQSAARIASCWRDRRAGTVHQQTTVLGAALGDVARAASHTTPVVALASASARGQRLVARARSVRRPAPAMPGVLVAATAIRICRNAHHGSRP